MNQQLSKKRLFIFSLIPILLFLFLLELSVRSFWEFEPNRVLCYDPIMGRSYCPGTKGYLKENQVKMHVEVNADGLLGKPYPKERFNGKFRIALLGDSFTSAEAVKPEEKFAGIWEKYLSDKSNRDVEVINFGVGGTGTWQQLQMFHTKARNYKPDLTVVAFCWCNDIENNIDKLKSGSMNPLLDEYDVGWFKILKAKRKNFNKLLWNNSGLYQFTRTKYNHLEHFFKRMFLPDYMKKVSVPLKKNKTKPKRKKVEEKKEKPPEYLKDTVSIFDDLFFFGSEGWVVTRKLLLKLKQEVLSGRGQLAVIHFGGVHQYRNFPVLPIQQFENFLESQGIAHFNAFDLFKNIDDDFLNQNFIPNDGHFSKIGHRHFAEYSSEFLLKLIEKINHRIS
tara:strand:- start:78 stop:1253 length:1176 start_codon:yes stop_codon:yes gene_type:complete